MHYRICEAATIKDTGSAKGRGVFASEPIAIDETVEVCPVVIVQARWSEIPEELRRVVFNWGFLTKSSPASCIALGWGSMYNHANPANVRYTADPNSYSMVFSAARDIDAGEELTINYNETGGDIHSTEDVWFKGTGIKPI